MSEATLEGDEIVIRIPLSALQHGCEYAWDRQYGPDGHSDLEITDTRALAKDLVLALNDEGTSGDTVINHMMDKAAVYIAENGSEGLAE